MVASVVGGTDDTVVSSNDDALLRLTMELEMSYRFGEELWRVRGHCVVFEHCSGQVSACFFNNNTSMFVRLAR